MLFPISMNQRVAASSLILEGKVVAQHSFWNTQHNMIYTSNSVEVLQVFKGKAPIQINVITEGGTLENTRIEHSSTLQLFNNQYGIFLCQPSSIVQDAFSVYSSLQGFIQYDLHHNLANEPFYAYPSITAARNAIETATHQKAISIQTDELLLQAINTMAQKTTATVAVKSFTPNLISGGTNSYLIIKGFGFGEERNGGFVEFPNANDGGQTFVQPTNAHYLFWNDSMIVLRMPSTVMTTIGCAGTGNFIVAKANGESATSLTPLTINFTYSNFDYKGFPFRSDLVNLNGMGGYSFQFNIAFQQNSGAIAAFNRALNSWCTTTMNWNIAPNNTTINNIAQDETNVVRFDEGNELPAGLLGKLISYYTGKGQPGQAYDWYVSEMDIVFDDAVNWNFDEHNIGNNQYDFQSVITHELGHGIQLNHVINTADLMHYSMDKGMMNHQPSFDDILGARYIIHQSLTTNANGPQPMRPLACNLPLDLLSFSGIVNDARLVSLGWKVSHETNLLRYELTRSTDNLHFTTIDTFHANNQLDISIYTASDSLVKDTVYYRLNIVSNDSSIVNSSTVLVNKTDNNNILIVYPNPARTDIILSTKAALIEKATFILYTSDGRSMLQQNLCDFSNLQDIRIPIYQLAAGFYFYEATINDVIYRGKLVKE